MASGGELSEGLPRFEYRKFDLDFKGLDLSNLCMTYIFVVGAEKTGKTTLVDPLTTRSTTDPFLPSFEHIGEFIRMTELGMIILRLLELKIENLGMPEILLTCRIRKHIFLFVYAFDDSTTLRFLYKNWIAPVKRVFSTVTTIMLGNKSDLKKDSEFRTRNPIYSDECILCYKEYFDVHFVFECSALTGDQLDFVFCVIALVGNKVKPS
ncbi:hypothetical protein CEXT_378501 [Caerostris extrusa]|uniref:Uncharacterized protein n=1 Tax=Caerostris extrusa TaxID=172846 RepID=A0AAV4RZ79_CAEEX|nr:hypothetical protein CEXT_378501 [Caerostris extrusa]